MKKLTTKSSELKVLTFADMQTRMAQPIACPLKWGQDTLKIELVAMMDGIKERVRAIRRAVQPPFKKDRGPHGDYDALDPKYLEASDLAERKARCVVVYFCWPELGKQRACATDDEITKFVSEMVPPPIQVLIAAKAEAGGIDLSASVNFTSPAGLES